jgi:DNA-binding winged helix-turn-helix (wHTH) protein
MVSLDRFDWPLLIKFSIMPVRQNPFPGKRKYLFGLILLLSVSIICVAFNVGDNYGFDSSRREVLLRAVGHEVLLQSGDRTSRVLPVKKIGDNEYQIGFEKELSFQPDSLVKTTRRVLSKDPDATDYVVNVLHCGRSGVVYGYAISKDKKDDIIACLGRKQPKACYVINIKFEPKGITFAKNGYLLGSLAVLAFAGFMLIRPVKPRKTLPDIQNTGMFTLASVLFDPKNRKLMLNEKTIDLTATENRVLLIFASSPNETIERSRLQKEIWEDEGVIVGRSLDMFISKLRKKLELDPDIRIAVIRGKGYKLETNPVGIS